MAPITDANALAETNDQIDQNRNMSVKLKHDTCHLKTQKKSLKQFEIRLDGDTLILIRPSKSSRTKDSKYTHNLNEVHVVLHERPAQCPKTGHLYYTLALVLTNDETRVLYFKSQELGTYWYNRLL